MILHEIINHSKALEKINKDVNWFLGIVFCYNGLRVQIKDTKMHRLVQDHFGGKEIQYRILDNQKHVLINYEGVDMVAIFKDCAFHKFHHMCMRYKVELVKIS